MRPKHLVVLRPHRSSPIDTDADMSPRTGFRVRGDGQCNQLHLKSGLIGISKSNVVGNAKSMESGE